MWHLTVCKISISVSFIELGQKWNDFYRISELSLATFINFKRYDKKKSFHFKNERLTEILQFVRSTFYDYTRVVQKVLSLIGFLGFIPGIF